MSYFESAEGDAESNKLSDAELRNAVGGVVSNVRTQRAHQWKGDLGGICLGSKEPLPPLIEPQLTGISPLGLGLDGYEEGQTPAGVIFYHQAWWSRMR
jgi:hypothetical protein